MTEPPTEEQHQEHAASEDPSAPSREPRNLESAAPSIFDRTWTERRDWRYRHRKVPRAGDGAVIVPGLGDGPEADEKPGYGSRRCWIGEGGYRGLAHHFRGVDTTRLPMSKVERAFRSTLKSAPDQLTNTEAPGDVEDLALIKKMTRRPRRSGAVVIPAVK